MMIVYQILFLLFAASLPLVVMAVMGRHILSMYRSVRSRKFLYVLYSLLANGIMILIFTGVGIIWFGYAVGHGHKAIMDDLLLAGISVIPIYGGGYGCWRLARYMDSITMEVAV